MQRCFILICLACALALLPLHSFAREPGEPPPDCFFACKEQYALLNRITEATDDRDIIKAYGKPFSQFSDDLGNVTIFKGTPTNLVIIRDPSNKAIRYAYVSAEGKPQQARIPWSAMGVEERWLFTLGDISFHYLKTSCGSDPVKISPRFLFFWTDNCYFGRPGRYKNFSFLFLPFNCNGEPLVDIDSFAPSTIRCPEGKKIRPAAVVVSLNGDEETDSVGAKILEWFIEGPPTNQTIVRPSFNCSENTAPDEQLICSDTTLAGLDVRLAQMYALARGRAGRQRSKDIRSAQERWWRRRRACGADYDCIVKLYKSRLSELR